MPISTFTVFFARAAISRRSTFASPSIKTRLKPKTFCALKLLGASLLSTLFLCAGTVHSAVIFSDDFSRSNSSNVGFGWQEMEKDASDTAIYQESLRLRDHLGQIPDGAAIQALDLSDYTALSLSFDWRANSSTETSDTLYVGWRLANETFESIWSTALGGSDFETQLLDLSFPELNQGSASLAFWTDMSSANETVYLDNILLSGDRISDQSVTSDTHPQQTGLTSTVPEPSSAALLVLGLACLGFRSKRHQAARIRA